jgi:hypothetical protein
VLALIASGVAQGFEALFNPASRRLHSADLWPGIGPRSAARPRRERALSGREIRFDLDSLVDRVPNQFETLLRSSVHRDAVFLHDPDHHADEFGLLGIKDVLHILIHALLVDGKIDGVVHEFLTDR